MTDKSFAVLVAASSFKFEEGGCGFLEDFNTKDYFGSYEDFDLSGKYFYVYAEQGDFVEGALAEFDYGLTVSERDIVFLYEMK